MRAGSSRRGAATGAHDNFLNASTAARPCFGDGFNLHVQLRLQQSRMMINLLLRRPQFTDVSVLHKIEGCNGGYVSIELVNNYTANIFNFAPHEGFAHLLARSAPSLGEFGQKIE
jgi:hypothetical protein